MRWLKWVPVLAVLPVVFNLVWLGTSTLKIENVSESAVGPVSYRACGRTHIVGTLKADQSAFRILEACGDDTLVVLIGRSEFCQIYVEGELYHIDATITAGDRVDCAYDDPFSSLFVSKALW